MRQELNFAGKKVVVSGLGDSVSCDEPRRCGGRAPQRVREPGQPDDWVRSYEGYRYEESEVAQGGVFCNLLLNVVEEEKLTRDRVDSLDATLLASYPPGQICSRRRRRIRRVM